MSNTNYSSLSTQDQRAVVEDVVSGEPNPANRELLIERARTEIETGTFYPLGEPVSSVRCDGCCAPITLNGECAAMKRFTVEETPASVILEQSPDLLCPDCTERPEKFTSAGEVGVVIGGVLERRRTRPGDDSDAPYLLHVTQVDDSDVEIVRSEPDDEKPNWSSFK